MDLRRLRFDDYDKISEIWDRCHKGKLGIPPRRFVVTEAVTENGKVTGYGVLRFFAEALLFLDTELPEYEKAKSFLLLLEQAIIDAKLAGLDGINVGTDDEEFAELLKRKFNFKERDRILYLDLEKEA